MCIIGAQSGVIAEGFRLLPHLVKPLLAVPGHAVWLLPTPAFRRAAFESRGSMREIARKTSNPDRALRNLLERDQMFTERLYSETKRLQLRVIKVDTSTTAALTQFPSVPSLMPRSLATCAIGLPVSRTSRTAPSRKSASNFLRVSAIAILLKATSPRYEGKPRDLAGRAGRSRRRGGPITRERGVAVEGGDFSGWRSPVPCTLQYAHTDVPAAESMVGASR
jgi:hypothetical protein